MPSIETNHAQTPPKTNSLISRLVSLITLLCFIAIVGLTIATIIAIAVPHWWLGDLLSHLRIHFAVGLLFCMIWFIPLRKRISLLILIPLFVNLSVLAPLYTSRSSANLSPDTLKILHYNLDKTTPSHEEAFAYLREHPADILFLQEVTPELADKFASELPDYRLIYAEPLDNTHGSALLLPVASTLTVQSTNTIHLPESSPRPLITATVIWDGQPLTLLSFHVVRPKNAYTENIQAAEFAAAADWIIAQRQNETPLIVIGDYNSTPWSARFQTFLNTSGLQDSSIGFGYQPTWSMGFPILFGLPIDHAVISPEIVVQDRAVGPQLGGDHAPLWITVALRK
ncbi:MAG: endonuclease/exonuclease/phosphatase family protein [Anaerolineales bacterium]